MKVDADKALKRGTEVVEKGMETGAKAFESYMNKQARETEAKEKGATDRVVAQEKTKVDLKRAEVEEAKVKEEEQTKREEIKIDGEVRKTGLQEFGKVLVSREETKKAAIQALMSSDHLSADKLAENLQAISLFINAGPQMPMLSGQQQQSLPCQQQQMPQACQSSLPFPHAQNSSSMFYINPSQMQQQSQISSPMSFSTTPILNNQTFGPQ